ncbi:substrate-binding domain-containing protein [bacterium]|jgi:simple sugar transport system substrate-binding protein|nr:substrate-binding domain-containing protein [bacterium]HAY68605.1 sugar ABC transporter substrate-binding protein [Acidimicrobiaceae bacterium]
MKRFKWLTLLLAFALFAAACGGSDSDTTEAADDTPAASDDAAADDAAVEEEEDVALSQGSDLTFHMITHSDDGPFWSVVKKGAEAAAADVGVELVWMPGNNDPGQMVIDIETAISDGSDGIASSLPSPDQLVGPLQEAVAAGINVYTLNSGVNDYNEIGATTHVGQTEFIAGQGAGNRFNAAGATHVLCGRQEQSNVGLDERCAGLEDAFSGTVTNEFVGLDADQTEQINGIKAILEADESIDGFLGTGPVIAVNGLTAANDLGRELVIGGFDVTPDIIDAIESGAIAFTVDQQQYLQGYLPVVLMFLQATNQNTAGGGLPILTGPGFITPDNAAAVKALVAEGTR